MVKTNEVIKFLKTQKRPVSFNTIWKNVKAEFVASLTKKLSEEVMMSDLYLSLIEEEKVIMVGNNKWSLREKYSLEDISKIEKDRFTEETILDFEDSDETKEISLKFKK